ncbi:MAG: ATP-dependent helicase C-terminal domain-containing protein, partial [Myxococcota bacterium]
GAGATSRAELAALPLATLWTQALPPAAQRALRRAAPTEVALKDKKVRVHYPAGAPPFVEGYVQDYYGLAEGPHLGGQPLTLKLWGPNRRPLQVTDDLAGFWTRHYLDLRKTLSRRYPKHHWPDHPATAPPKLLRRHLSSSSS